MDDRPKREYCEMHNNPYTVGFHLSRRQFALQLAFAMTINKSQGQPVKNVGIHFQTPVFTHGQFYVTMSRCTSGNFIP